VRGLATAAGAWLTAAVVLETCTSRAFKVAGVNAVAAGDVNEIFDA
jgi:hypothetical protein